MKRLLFSLLTLAAASFLWAGTVLIVHQKSGGIVKYSFCEKPVVTYNGGNLVVSGKEALVEYPLSEIKKFTFGLESDQITRITASEETVPQPTYIYNIDGVLICTLQTIGDGKASLVGLPIGIYIIKNGTTTYKIIKRK